MWHTYLKLNGLTKGKKHLIWVLYCTIPYLVTDSAQCTCTFLRYRHSNYSLIITRSSATAEIARDAWNDNSRSLKVIRYCTNRRGIYDFLLPCELHNSGKTQHPKSGTARTAKNTTQADPLSKLGRLYSRLTEIHDLPTPMRTSQNRRSCQWFVLV